MSTAPALFFFESSKLEPLAAANHERYQNAKPFPHIYFDNFLPTEVVDGVLEEFPDKTDRRWQAFKDARETKLANNQDELMPPRIRHLLAQFNSAAMCRFLETLTGIAGIIPDPHFWGGGQHQIERGGYLKLHADFNKHTKLNLDRRINLLLYLNKDWEESYGGHLEFWDERMEHCEQRILPLFNRVAIFSTTSTSYHGHPDPLTCPEGRFRKSLALYYYTNGRPEEERNAKHTTLFRARPGEEFEDTQIAKPSLLRRCVPPILVDLARALKKRG